MLALTVFEILTFEICYCENVGQGHRIKHCIGAIRWQIQEFTKVIFRIFYLALTVSKIIKIQILSRKCRSMLRSVTSMIVPFDGKYQNLIIAVFSFFSLLPLNLSEKLRFHLSTL